MLQLPNELLHNVFQYLEVVDLRTLRNVSSRLAKESLVPLFKSITISCLTLENLSKISNHAQIAPVVEQLQFREIHFPPSASFRKQWTLDIINAHYQDRHPGGSLLFSGGERSNELFEQDCGTRVLRPPGLEELGDEKLSDLFSRLVDDVLHDYSSMNEADFGKIIFDVMVECLPKLSKLRRIKCGNADAGGIFPENTSYMPDSLKTLNQYFPMSDVIVRALNSNHRFVETTTMTGSIAILRAMSTLNPAYDSNITDLVIEPNSGLFMVGIFDPNISSLDPLLTQAADGFWSLRNIKMCIDRNAIRRKLQYAELFYGLQVATRIENLDISVKDNGEFGLDFLEYLQNYTFPSLLSFRLQGLDCPDSEPLTRFLFRNPQLQKLTLHDITLLGLWQVTVQRWADNPNFTLTELEIYKLRDEGDLGWGFHGTRENAEFSRVSSAALLEFINGHEESNPFITRRWTPEDQTSHILNEGDNLSDFSDMSLWKDRNEDFDITEADEPFEWDSNYETDDDCDSDIDMTI